MKMIRLTRASDGAEIWINNIRIVSIAKAINDNTTMIDTQCEDGSLCGVTETVDEVLRLISDDPDPVMTCEEVLSSANQNIRRVAELEDQVKAWTKAANKGSQASIISPSDLETRIEVYEEQLKAWQDAANIDLVENKGEPAIFRETPEQLIERIRHLYRWAATAENRANKAEVLLRNLRDKILNDFEDSPF